MELSIIIACSRPEFMDDCLKGFTAQQTEFQFEIIVAGNVSGINHAADNVRLLEVKEPHPNSKRNRGLAFAKANLVALIDDDTIPNAKWVETAMQFSRNYPDAVLAGPENPYPSANDFARLTHQLLSSPVAEFSKAHTHSKFETLQWFDVPFCNTVFPKQMWLDAKGLDETIPWHMDDFHFFFPFRNKVTFLNIPEMHICHNRYPGSLKELLIYKWRLRKETGEKLMSHPHIYCLVTPVKAALILSLSVLMLLFGLMFINPIALTLVVGTYFLLLFLVSIWRIGLSVPVDILNEFLLLTAVQLISMAGLYYGLLGSAVNSFKNKHFK